MLKTGLNISSVCNCLSVCACAHSVFATLSLRCSSKTSAFSPFSTCARVGEGERVLKILKKWYLLFVCASTLSGLVLGLMLTGMSVWTVLFYLVVVLFVCIFPRPFPPSWYDSSRVSHCRDWPVCSSDKTQLLRSWPETRLTWATDKAHQASVRVTTQRIWLDSDALYRRLNLEPFSLFDSWWCDSWLCCNGHAHTHIHACTSFCHPFCFVSVVQSKGQKVIGTFCLWL